ncbi:MAG: GNAT family N-acetyltransferase [Sideroxydans sp.]|nr:GNAT family N-acetyltransferase [Sideroxydans sp.]
MRRYEFVNPAEYIPQITDLLRANWAETGVDFPLEPDVTIYQTLHDMGIGLALAVFEDDVIIGYCTATMTPHQFNSKILCCVHDALYIRPDKRHGSIFQRIKSMIEQEAAKRGATRMFWHCRAGTGLADSLIKHGYEHVDTVVMGRLLWGLGH